jgi:nitrate reductase NapE component
LGVVVVIVLALANFEFPVIKVGVVASNGFVVSTPEKVKILAATPVVVVVN